MLCLSRNVLKNCLLFCLFLLFQPRGHLHFLDFLPKSCSFLTFSQIVWYFLVVTLCRYKTLMYVFFLTKSIDEKWHSNVSGLHKSKPKKDLLFHLFSLMMQSWKFPKTRRKMSRLFKRKSKDGFWSSPG